MSVLKSSSWVVNIQHAALLCLDLLLEIRLHGNQRDASSIHRVFVPPFRGFIQVVVMFLASQRALIVEMSMQLLFYPPGMTAIYWVCVYSWSEQLIVRWCVSRGECCLQMTAGRWTPGAAAWTHTHTHPAGQRLEESQHRFEMDQTLVGILSPLLLWRNLLTKRRN